MKTIARVSRSRESSKENWRLPSTDARPCGAVVRSCGVVVAIGEAVVVIVEEGMSLHD